MKHTFNDDSYCATIEEWENERLPRRTISQAISWSLRLLPVLVIVGISAIRPQLHLWLCLVVLAWVLISLFTFLDEINENIRFMRHQNRVLRRGVRNALGTLGACNEPDRGVRLITALQILDREWEDPR